MTEAEQLDAILHGAAFAAITDRAFLRVTGSDATRWLNGMVTNNIAALAPGEGNYNFLLNAQGRIQGDCTIYREPDRDQPAFLLATQNSQLETIRKTLDHFIIMDDVELKAADYYDQPLLLLGPKAPEILRKIEHPNLDYTETYSKLPPLHLAFYGLTANPIFTPPSGSACRFEVSSESREIMIEEAKEAGAVEVSSETLEVLRILEARPKFGADIRDRDLPQETGQTHALHFAKGCYLGQEIVERIRSRGQVHRQFTQFRLTGELPASLPARLEANGKAVGEITSAALIPLPEGPILLALGYARREALETHQPLTYPGGTALATGN